jgi:hypothetical protein
MSQKVNAVPDSSFSVPPLTTTAGTRVSRRRLKVPCNYPGTKYSHNGQSALPTVVTFDIADNESFLDIDKSMIVLDFTPQFHSSADIAKKYPLSNIGFNDSSQALMARVRIGNSQGLIIEELQAYGTWSNIMESYSLSDSEKEYHLLDVSSSKDDHYVQNKDSSGVGSSQKRLRSHVTRRLFLRFKHSSFLKSCRMIPLFLMRNGIRFEIEFQHAQLAMTRKISPSWSGPYYAVGQNIEAVQGNSANALATRAFADWYVLRSSTFAFPGGADANAMYIALRKSSRLVQDLKLDQLIINNINRDVDFSAANAVTGASWIVDAPLSVPIKLEYTDELGSDRVLYQGIGEIRQAVHMLEGTTGNLQLAWNQPWQHLAAQFGNISGNGNPIYTGFSFAQFRQLYYVVKLRTQQDGFVGPVINTQSPDGSAMVPYASGRPRIYVDLNDVVRLAPEGNVNYVVANANNSNVDDTTFDFAWSESNLGSQPRAANRDVSRTIWNYQCANIEMICDLVKPSSEVFLQFQQSFQAPAGIPYAYKRVLYHTRVLQPSDGLQQISLPFSVRSLRGLICVISDKAAWSPTADPTSKNFPSLSAFMKRGLYRAQLVIGGQSYPNYDLNLTELGVEQIPELECLFNVAALGSFNPNFDLSELYSSHNYLSHTGKLSVGAPGTLPFDNAMTLKDVVDVAGKCNAGFQEYHDTSKFVLGLSTMKKDGDFVTGVDTSQAGSMSLNLYFKSEPDVANGYPGDSGSKLKRDLFIQVFGIADAVFTLQNDANLVRY